MDDVADTVRAAAPRMFEAEPVAFAYLIGSHATGTSTARSDVDIAVHL
jgi:predicted nucleotidyltransferase